MDRDPLTVEWALLSKRTIKDIINRYVDEIAPEVPLRSETNRALRAIERTSSFLGDPVERLTAESISSWRDERLEQASAATVATELDVLAVMLEIARTEWGWLQYNPALAVSRPRQQNGKRIGGVSDLEAQALCEALGYAPGEMVGSAPGFTALTFLLLIETGIRKHEALSLRWPDVFLEQSYLNISGRVVPLSRHAVRLFEQLYRFDDEDRCIPLDEDESGKVWRRARAIATKKVPSVAKLDFNDARDEAQARMAKRMDLLPLSRIVDQKNLALLVPHYLSVPA